MNVNHNRRLSEKHRIRVVPTFVYIVDGEEVRRQTGGVSEDVLRLLWRPALF